MLREIPNTRQVAGEKPRRWFFSHEQDLLVWLEDGRPFAFQLAYDKYHSEHAIRWKPEAGFSHYRVDTGVDVRELPLLVPAGPFDVNRVLGRFMELAADVPDDIRQFVSRRMREHPQYLDDA
jgi:hypothetical protein